MLFDHRQRALYHCLEGNKNYLSVTCTDVPISDDDSPDGCMYFYGLIMQDYKCKTITFLEVDENKLDYISFLLIANVLSIHLVHFKISLRVKNRNQQTKKSIDQFLQALDYSLEEVYLNLSELSFICEPAYGNFIVTSWFGRYNFMSKLKVLKIKFNKNHHKDSYKDLFYYIGKGGFPSLEKLFFIDDISDEGYNTNSNFILEKEFNCEVLSLVSEKELRLLLNILNTRKNIDFPCPYGLKLRLWDESDIYFIQYLSSIDHSNLFFNKITKIEFRVDHMWDEFFNYIDILLSKKLFPNLSEFSFEYLEWRKFSDGEYEKVFSTIFKYQHITTLKSIEFGFCSILFDWKLFFNILSSNTPQLFKNLEKLKVSCEYDLFISALKQTSLGFNGIIEIYCMLDEEEEILVLIKKGRLEDL
jgi:hypothetical protein